MPIGSRAPVKCGPGPAAVNVMTLKVKWSSPGRGPIQPGLVADNHARVADLCAWEDKAKLEQDVSIYPPRDSEHDPKGERLLWRLTACSRCSHENCSSSPVTNPVHLAPVRQLKWLYPMSTFRQPLHTKEDGKLALDTQTIKELKRLIATAERLISANSRSNVKSAAATTKRTKKRTRRTGKDLIQFRKMLKTERSKGISVAALARKHSISTAYIYQL
jgi:hypothetical protein